MTAPNTKCLPDNLWVMMRSQDVERCRFHPCTKLWAQHRAPERHIQGGLPQAHCVSSNPAKYKLLRPRALLLGYSCR